MPVQWTDELVAPGDGDPVMVRAAQRWRVRVVSDRSAVTTPSSSSSPSSFPASRSEDFLAILDDEFHLWLRHPEEDAYRAHARGGGVAIEVVADVTAGVEHRTSVRRKPSDDLRARWSCTCGASGRGDAAPDVVTAAAEAHVEAARARDGATTNERGGRSRDAAVAQDDRGQWSKRDVAAVRRFRTCVRSDRSVVRAHQRGHGEEFELVVDGRLGLWARGLGSDAALRTDCDARGVSLILLEVA